LEFGGVIKSVSTPTENLNWFTFINSWLVNVANITC
jgi:hypothetical protein